MGKTPHLSGQGRPLYSGAMPTAAPWHATIPGCFGLPLLGETLKFHRDFLGFTMAKLRRHGTVFKTHLFGEVTVALLGAEANRFLLVEEVARFSSQAGWAVTLGELFDGGVMLMDGEVHRRHRAILQAAFRRPALEVYGLEVDRVVAARLDAWRDRSPRRLLDAIKELTLDIAARVFIGLELERDVSRINAEFLRLVGGSIAFVRRRIPGTVFWRALAARRALERFFARIVEERRADPGQSLLGRLMTATGEGGERLTDDEIVGHMIFLLMAAHDTTTSALTSLVYELGRHPDWRARLRAAGPGSDDGRWAAYEALRLHTPLVAIPRRSIEEVDFAGHRIPAGVVVAISPAVTHRMTDYWTDPDRFDPERFAEGRAEHRRTSCAFIPFGAGPHTCLGQGFAEMEIDRVLTALLERFDWQAPEGYLAPYQQVPFQAPRDGLPIPLVPRR